MRSILPVILLLALLDPAHAAEIPEELVETLSSEDSAEQVDALLAVARFGADGAPHLVPLLTDDSVDVRYNARRELAAMGMAAVPALLAGLGHDDRFVRARSAELLSQTEADPEVVVPALRVVLADEEDWVREWVATALGSFGASAAEPLREAAEDPELQVRRRAIASLGRIGPAGVPHLVFVLEKGTLTYSDDTEEAFLESGEDAVPALIELLTAEDRRVRATAAKYLGKIGSAAAAPALRKRFEDADEWVRVQSVLAWWRITGDTATVEPLLLRMLSSDTGSTVRHSAEALIVIAPQSGDIAARLVATIEERRGDSDAAISALRAIGAPAVPTILAALEAGTERDFTLLDALSEIRPLPPSAAPHLIRFLDHGRGYDGSPGTALLDMGEAAVPYLVDASRAGPIRIRRNVVVLLGRLGETAGPAAPELARLLDEEEIRLTAAEALISIEGCSTRVRVMLESILDSGKASERREAFELLEKAGALDADLLAGAMADAKGRSRGRIALAWWRATGDPGPAIEAYLPSIRGGWSGWGNEATQALEEIGEPAVKPLIGLLDHENSNGRGTAIKTLEAIGPAASGAIPALIERLGDESDSVRSYAADALGAIGPAAKGAVPALLEMLQRDEYQWARMSAAQALARIAPDSEGLATLLDRGLRAGSTVERRAYALSHWRATGDPAPAVAVFVDFLEDPETSRSETRDVLYDIQKMGPAAAGAFPALIEELDGEHPDAAARALAAIAPRDPRVIDGLIRLLDSPDWGNRSTAARELGRIGPPAKSALRRLEPRTRDPNLYVRQEARKAIEAIGR